MNLPVPVSFASNVNPDARDLAALDIGPEIDWAPDRIADSAWLEHVPFAFWLIKSLQPRQVVELGTMAGVSYAAFCQAVERFALPSRCTAVDTWRGDDHAGHYDESVYESLRDFNDRYYRRFSTLLRSTFSDAVPAFADGAIDLLHIDGLHTYEAAAGDFATWRPKLSDRAVVLFHDINVHRDDFGVWRLWAELAPHHPHFEFLHGYGLGVLGFGASLPPPLLALFKAAGDPASAAAIRDLFARRGAAILTTQQLEAARRDAAALRADNEALQGALRGARDLYAQASAEAARMLDRLHETAEANARLERRLAEAVDRISELRSTLTRQRADILGGLSRQINELRDAVSLAAGQRQIQAEQEQAIRDRLAHAEARCAALLDSTSWRVTAPLRALSLITAEPRRALRGRPLPRLRGRRVLPQPPAALPFPRDERPAAPAGHAHRLAPRVLIVAEMSLPQCRKYRVEQKQAMIRSLGWDCTAISWHDIEVAISLMQTHSLVLFYRVPAFPDVMRVLQEAQRLGVPHYFELDDLIFDISDYAANPNLAGLDSATAESLFDGAILYRKALTQCRNIIASTPFLAERMQGVGGGDAFVIENALDAETLRIAQTIRPREPDGRVRIIYGSGTRTHDADFALVAPALRRIADEHPEVEILLIGELTPPRALRDLGEQLVRLPARPYADYMDILGRSDIAVAPLMAAFFNDAKSNIKFLEAAAVGVSSVCSPRSAFVHAVRHGETGFLADTDATWYAALKALVTDADLRHRIGDAARADVLERYSPRAIARRQLLPLLAKHAPAPDPRLHIMQVNILYRPQSFGGATVVAEAMVRHLASDPDTRVSVVTSAPAGWLRPYNLECDDDDGVPVFRIGIQDRAGWMDETWDEHVAEVFHHILRGARPDVVHFHAIQGFGAAALRVCQEENIPYVVTLHDAWWLCARQFLVTGEGKYCGQQTIDMNVCATCVPNIGTTVLRNARLRQVLDRAALLLTPSAHWRRFHLANGFLADRVAVNENGIDLPVDPPPNEGPARLRFGFVAGTEAVKGFPLLKRTFESLRRSDWELVLVNHGLSIGQDSFAGIKWNVRGTVRTVPPFTPEDRDTFYAQVDVLLFPSQWPESFGLTVREALARNKWVIATDRGGAAEAVSPGINGTLIPIGNDPVPFRDAIESLLDRRPDLHNWTNPAAGRLRSFADQARELRDLLASVSKAPAERTAMESA